MTVAGIRGSGKSNNTWNFIKEKQEENIPIAILSPTREYRGIPDFYTFDARKYNAKNLAKAVRKYNVSVVIETKGMDIVDKRNWVNDFSQTLMDDEHINPLIVVVEESHEYVPQKRGLKAFHLLDLAKESRKYGIGILFVTQSIAELDKDAFRQSNHLLIHRLKTEVDLDYVAKEVSAWGWDKKDVKELIPSLDDGQYFHFDDDGVYRVSDSPLAEDKPFGHTPKFDKITVDKEGFEKEQKKESVWQTLKNPLVQILIWTLVTIAIIVTVFIYFRVKFKGLLDMKLK